MLGKGLESLIPQKGGQGNGGGSGPVPSRFDPQKVASVPHGDAPQGAAANVPNTPPPLELPVLHDSPAELPQGGNLMDEAELPPAADEPALPSGDGVPDALPAHRSDPLVSPLTESSISVTARNVASGAPTAAAAFLGKKNQEKEPSGPAVAGSVFHIETEKIVPNPNQPRRHFDESALKDLAYSIREFGVLQPLVITKRKHETSHGLDVEYELIAGERRLLAAKLLGLKTVPAIIRDVDLEREKLELAVIENLQRENLSAIETARAFERLRDEFKMTQREIAAKLGKSREVVANTVRLLDLPTYAQEALEKGTLSESNARFLLSIEDQGAQRKLFDDIMTHGLTTRDVKDRIALIERVNGGVRRRGRPRKDAGTITPELLAIQDELSSELGAPVEIEKKADAGKITITFYSEEELENIVKRLGKEN